MSKGVNSAVLVVAVLGSLVFVNVLGWNLFSRLDLTEDQRFTLSAATRTMLDRLEDPVTIRAYFSEKMSPRFSNNRRYVRDILDEYYAASDGNVAYEFIDPVTEETQEDKAKKKDLKKDIFGRIVREKTSVEQELETLGIQPVQDTVVEGDGLENRKVYMGIVVRYGDETEVIPVVGDTGTLEYDLTTMIRKLTRPKAPKLAVMSGFGGPTQQEGLQYLFGLLGENYEVSSLDLSTDATIPDDIDAVLVIGPTNTLSEDAKRELDRFIVNGRAAAFFLDDHDIDMQTLQPTPIDHGLKPMLSSWGVSFSDEMVLDPECQTISVSGGASLGGIPIPQPIQYPLIPSPKQLNPDHVITRGLGETVFPFVKSVSLDPAEGSEIEVAVLANSSPEARLLKGAVDTNPFNLQQLTIDQVTEQATHNFLVTMNGTFPSSFAPTDAEGGEVTTGNARLLVAGTSRFIRDELMRSPTHQALALNLIDWLVLDEALLKVRTRGLASAPIEELSDATRASIRYGNIVGLPLLFIFFGLVRWRMRESRRAHVSF